MEREREEREEEYGFDGHDEVIECTCTHINQCSLPHVKKRMEEGPPFHCEECMDVLSFSFSFFFLSFSFFFFLSFSSSFNICVYVNMCMYICIYVYIFI